MRLRSMGEGGERLLEAREGRGGDAGADLADAGPPVRDAGVDGRGDAGLDDPPEVDAGRRAGEFERRNGPPGIPCNGELAHRLAIADRLGEAAGADEARNGGRRRPRTSAPARRPPPP